MRKVGAVVGTGLALLACLSYGQIAGTSGKNDLVIVQGGKTEAIAAISPTATAAEKTALADLASVVTKMTGAQLTIAETAESVAAALKETSKPVFLIGTLALTEKPDLGKALAGVSKKNPLLRADAIVVKREKNRIYLAGSNSDSQAFAVAELLRRWGCRWFMPTEFGECIPEHSKLIVGDLDYAYGSPFEIRKYWISWNGDSTGTADFKRRNMMNEEVVPNGHCLARYTKDLGDMFKIPVAELATAEHVAKQIAEPFSKGERIMLGMEDGNYRSDSPKDKELMALQYDKYFLMPAMTDAFLEFYNNVAKTLLKQYPDSKGLIGFLAYGNITMPPVRDMVAEKPLVAYLAPIDIDPIHGMDDPISPPRQEYREMMYKWAKVMQGRLAIYDYDQGMLVWRDIPNPSIASLKTDIGHYRKAGILGVDTESRGAFGTIFVNLYVRGQLLWNPDQDVDGLLADFYPAFYGPAAAPMAKYWNAIFKAWADSIVTEHEYFVAPAIYTPQVIAQLKKDLEAAEAAIQPISGSQARNDKLYVERMRFTRLSFNTIENYIAMVREAASECNYAAACAAGDKALAARAAVTALNGILTTYDKPGIPEVGPAWFPGEVQQYRDLAQYIDGTKGTLVHKLPLEWAFRRDKKDQGLKEKYATAPVDLAYWKEKGKTYTVESRKDYPTDQWEMLRTDLYIQAQGVRDPDQQSYTGFGWYRVDVDITADQAGKPLHIMFPGLFNDCWLYVNGAEIKNRGFTNPMWWFNDYKFEWDVDLTGKLKAGKNTIALRINNPHHFGGMFRRPFIYAAK